MRGFRHSRVALPSGAIAGPFIGDNYAWHIAAALEQFAEGARGGVLVTLGGHQDIENVALLIHCSPQVTGRATDFEEDLIEMPLVAGLRPAAPQVVGLDLAECAAPLTNSFAGHMDPAGGEKLFDSTVTEGETKIEPDSVRDDHGGITVALVQRRIRG